MARGSYNLGGEEVREESSWRYPLIILFTTLVLCVIFLYHYVGPDVDELQGNKPRPTISDNVIDASVGSVKIAVPENFTVFPRDRREGQREALTLYASWPRMGGYTPSRRDEFLENKWDTRRIDIIVQKKRAPLDEQARLDILYMPHVIDGEGRPFEHGLTRFTFKQQSAQVGGAGYTDKEMLLGKTEDGELAVIFCYFKTDNGLPSECYREYDLSQQVSVKYYFKRNFLPDWRRIDSRVQELISTMRAESAA